jgi:hypothetical protein
MSVGPSNEELERSVTNLAMQLIEVQFKQLVQKRLFGGYEVPLLKFRPVGLWLFNKAAIFGQARRDKIEIISKMFVGQESIGVMFEYFGLSRQVINDEQRLSAFMHKVGMDALNNYHNKLQKEPESLQDLWEKCFAPTEFDSLDILLDSNKALDKAKILAKKKIKLSVALQWIKWWLFTGISFGVSFPELVERMWRQEYEMVSQETWTRARQAGVDLPETFTSLRLEDMEQEVLVEVAAYVTEYFPELVDPLDLRIQ